ncbi:unnamed protein product, partial [Schistosoma curassoni]|uniref:Peptidase_M16 domain-containing protein n=1 Tax=Schistosoma curassoni TaxID=6186 RepID=A0A183KWC8_9TREM
MCSRTDATLWLDLSWFASAAALCINVGSFSDPHEAQGLSHLLEHSKFNNSSHNHYTESGLSNTVLVLSFFRYHLRKNYRQLDVPVILRELMLPDG